MNRNCLLSELSSKMPLATARLCPVVTKEVAASHSLRFPGPHVALRQLRGHPIYPVEGGSLLDKHFLGAAHFLDSYKDLFIHKGGDQAALQALFLETG